jgi:hypothetical protein
MLVRCYGWKNNVNLICCFNKKGFRNGTDGNNDVKMIHDLLSGNEILARAKSQS